ncbi:hypothetical protein SAMN05428963_12519 [Consotaella salsifontis]|uniref:Uncharacterized protein n=1 Tax=Consotaella salsifontis TaxID=1365950 RepID=A0A1T4TD96_9HYPH|nr:hypothetical protein SAMN05428963_12519 [Consotaella salsifontis]
MPINEPFAAAEMPHCRRTFLKGFARCFDSQCAA